MTDWTSPHALQVQADALQKLSLVFIGIYFYEFVCTVQFDWSLITRQDSQRPLLARSVKWLYLACRYTTLGASVCLALLNLSHGALRCQAMITIFNLIGFCAAATATALLFVRVGVIWEWKHSITASFTIAYLVILATGLRSVILIRAVYIATPMGSSCETTSGSGLELNRWNVLVDVITDVVLIVSLFLGLSRRWSDVRTSGSGIWYVLWNQNIIYFVLAIALEIPMTAFYFLKSNESVILLFTVPETVILPIAATRFYRSLTGFTGNSSSYGYESTAVHISQRPKPRAADSHRTAGLAPSDLERDDEYGMDFRDIRLRDLSVSESGAGTT